MKLAVLLWVVAIIIVVTVWTLLMMTDRWVYIQMTV